LTAPLFARFTGHKGSVYALADARDGRFFSSGADGWVVEWRLDSPEQGRLLAQMPGAVYAISFLPEKQLLAVAVNNDGFHFLDLRDGALSFALASGEGNWFRMKNLPDGRILASGSGGRIALIEPEERSIKFFQSGMKDLRSVAHLPGGNIVLGTSGPAIRMHDSGLNFQQEINSGHSKTIFGLAAYPDGRRMLSSGRDAKLNLHEKNDSGNWEIRQSVPAHLYGIHDVCLHPQKTLLASGSMDKTIKIWDAENLRLLRVLDRSRHDGHSHSVNQLCWLAEPDLLLSCSDDRSILAWDIYQ
jgi:WD40 repeat protein